jgi:hypothetical protein
MSFHPPVPSNSNTTFKQQQLLGKMVAFTFLCFGFGGGDEVEDGRFGGFWSALFDQSSPFAG